MVSWTAFAFLPVIATVAGSLKTTDEITANPLGLPSSLQFGNFSTAWTGPEFGEPLWRYAVNSIIAVGVGISVGMAAGVLVGYALARNSVSLSLLNRYFVILLTIPVVVTWVPLFGLASSLNILSSPAGLGVIYAAGIIPLATVLMRTYFGSFPLDLIEAAKVDGASEFYAFRAIVLPMSKGVIGIVALIQAITLWNELALAVILLLNQKSQTLTVGLSEFRGEFNANLGPQYAGLLLAIIPMVILYIFTQRRITEGMRLGALK
jgi:ABC-type glycerol-3-phosphate transport system permease component